MEVLNVPTPDGINWHVKRFSDTSTASVQNPEYIILIPSGEGDCDSLISTAAYIRTLIPSSVVVIFDTPGFSRSTAIASAYASINPSQVAEQIITLLDTLSISTASFWGSSSAGGAVLTLLTLHPERVKRAMVHEVPLFAPPPFVAMKKESDEVIRDYCRKMMETDFIEKEDGGREKWQALGEEYHKRLDANYVVWIRNLVECYEVPTKELISQDNYAGLKQKPLHWTVGGLSDPDKLWKPNFEVAEVIGLQINTKYLMSGHFPQVTIPETLAEWIAECINSTTA